ncbi:MAG: hypothetical protein JO312_04055, partial [Hyphomicrobiales bacterium]|nr:hypothetical protein [Hyphomicrobiales bacterium]
RPAQKLDRRGNVVRLQRLDPAAKQGRRKPPLRREVDRRLTGGEGRLRRGVAARAFLHSAALQIAYAAGDFVVYDNATGTVSIEASGGSTVATFKVSGTYTSASFDVGADSSGDLLVSVANAILWQNTGGQAAIWDMKGTNIVGGGIVSPQSRAVLASDRHGRLRRRP